MTPEELQRLRDLFESNRQPEKKLTALQRALQFVKQKFARPVEPPHPKRAKRKDAA